jgi:hypothetical protein
MAHTSNTHIMVTLGLETKLFVLRMNTMKCLHHLFYKKIFQKRRDS